MQPMRSELVINIKTANGPPLDVPAIVDELIDGTFRNASIDGGKMTLWVIHVGLDVRWGLPVYPQLRRF
jgi:hypothetical protein